MPSFLRKDNRNRAPCENNKEQQNKANNLYYISGWFNIPNAPAWVTFSVQSTNAFHVRVVPGWGRVDGVESM